jgi:TPR repeat protein
MWLGHAYQTGQGGRQDYAEAARWYRLAAAQGDAASQCNLGVLYQNGQGVPRDYVEAAKWFHSAAVQGHAIAQFNLAGLYETGCGVPWDAVEAAKWYRRAADAQAATRSATEARRARRSWTWGTGAFVVVLGCLVLVLIYSTMNPAPAPPPAPHAVTNTYANGAMLAFRCHSAGLENCSQQREKLSLEEQAGFDLVLAYLEKNPVRLLVAKLSAEKLGLKLSDVCAKIGQGTPDECRKIFEGE